MPINHAFTSGKSDGGDATLVRPSNWNEPHVGGGLVLLEQHTASSSAALNFTTCISSTYDEYSIEFINIIPATDGADLQLRVSTDGGSTYISSSSYYWNCCVSRLGAAAATGSASDTKISLTYPTVLSNNANWGVCGSLRLFNPRSTSVYKRFQGINTWLSTDGFDAENRVWGTYLAVTAIDAVRFLMSSGNIASGTIRFFGFEK